MKKHRTRGALACALVATAVAAGAADARVTKITVTSKVPPPTKMPLPSSTRP